MTPALRNPDALPSPASPQARHRLETLRRALRWEIIDGRGQWMIGRHDAPTQGERELFATRSARIKAALAPAGEEAARRALARLAAGLRPRAFDGPPALAELAAREAARVLTALPAGPLGEAVDRFIDGRLGKGGFAPEAAEVARATRDIADAWAGEAETLAAAAAATVHDRLAWHADERPGETPEQRAERRRAVAEQARRVAHENAMRVASRDRAERGIPEPPPPETPEQALDRLAGELRAAPLTAGPGLMATWAKGAG